VYTLRSQRLPLFSDINRILREDRLLSVVTLIEANTLAALEVYGRDYFHLFIHSIHATDDVPEF